MVGVERAHFPPRPFSVRRSLSRDVRSSGGCAPLRCLGVGVDTNEIAVGSSLPKTEVGTCEEKKLQVLNDST